MIIAMVLGPISGIAPAGGTAGAYATFSPRLSVGLVGAAIATALVPPLSTRSLCLARGETRLAFGGFLLFFANLVAIQFASSLVMFLNGYHNSGHKTVTHHLLVKRNVRSFVLLIGLATVLGYDFSQSLNKQNYDAALRAQLEQQLHAFPGVHLADLTFRREAARECASVSSVRRSSAVSGWTYITMPEFYQICRISNLGLLD